MKLTTLFITLLLFGLIDLYVYKGVSAVASSWHFSNKLLISIGYWAISALSLGLLIYGIVNRSSFKSSDTLTLIMGVFVSLLLPKLVFLFFHAVDDLYNLGEFAVSKITHTTDYSRRNFISQVGLLASGFMFGSMVYGVLWGKFNFRIIRENISSSRVPNAFDGLKIVQISDAHLGSFGESF